MENLYEVGLELTRWLQTNYPQLAPFFAFYTDLGSEEFFLAVLPFIYWCADKRLGRELGFFFFVSIGFNTTLKQAFRGPRPFWLDPSLGMVADGGFGVPSGHTQYATALYLFVAAWLRSTWIAVLALVMIGVMALSRIYLGAHFIHDVVGGFIFGLLSLLFFFVIWRKYLAGRFGKRILGQRMLIIVAIPLATAAVFAGLLWVLGAPDLTVPWADYVVAAELSSIAEMAVAFGAMLGFGIGMLLEGSRIRFRSDGPVSKRALRYLVGIMVTVAIWLGLGELFPREPLLLAIPLRIIRYFLVALWAAYFAPLVFVRFGLAQADPPPALDLKL